MAQLRMYAGRRMVVVGLRLAKVDLHGAEVLPFRHRPAQVGGAP